jgi:hypothetical protein
VTFSNCDSDRDGIISMHEWCHYVALLPGAQVRRGTRAHPGLNPRREAAY